MTTERKPLPRARARRAWKVALMVLCCLGLLAAWLLFALGTLYPRYLARTAPEEALPYLATAGEQSAAALTPEMTPEARIRAYDLRDNLWRRGLLALQGGGVVLMYLMVLLWRLHLKRHALPYGRQARRAGSTCFVTGLAVLLAQLGLAWVCWHYGLRFVAGRTRWDYLCALGCYPLTWLCSVPLRRLGAPAAYCARRGAFRRL